MIARHYMKNINLSYYTKNNNYILHYFVLHALYVCEVVIKSFNTKIHLLCFYSMMTVTKVQCQYILKHA